MWMTHGGGCMANIQCIQCIVKNAFGFTCQSLTFWNTIGGCHKLSPKRPQMQRELCWPVHRWVGVLYIPSTWTGSRCTVHVLKSARTTRFCVRFRVFHRRVDRPSMTLVYCKSTPDACFRIHSSSYQSSCSSVTKQTCSLTSIGKSAFTQALIISSLHNRKWAETWNAVDNSVARWKVSSTWIRLHARFSCWVTYTSCSLT